jgi:D-amino peptidase
MKILISADMEGATGVTWPADVQPGTEQWQRCRRMFTSDVDAAIAGFFDGGAEEVLVNEAHATMRNLLLEERTGERSVAYTSGTAWDMIRCFKAVTTLIAAATENVYG